MRIGVISSSVFKCPPVGYAGLEMVAYWCARGLAALGHRVSLLAPEGSRCEGCEVIPTGPPGGWDEAQAYERYWKELPRFEVIIDHSVTGNEKLLVKIDGHCRWTSMEELYRWAESTAMTDRRCGSDEIRVEGLEVPAAVSIHDVQWKPVSAVIRHRRAEPIHEVETSGGHRVAVTAGHSMMVAGPSGLESVTASSSVGRFAATCRQIPAAKNDVQKWPVEFEVVRHVVTNHRAKHRQRIVEWPPQLTDDDLTLFGLWVGDGCYDGDRAVCLASGLSTRRTARRVATEFDATLRTNRTRPDVKHQINSTLLVALMKAAGFTGDSHTKKVPDWVFDLSSRQIGLFLKGYFSADGCASGRVCLSSVNEGLIRQVVVLMAMCGIRTNVCRNWTTGPDGWNSCGWCWELSVPVDQVRRFLKLIGFEQSEKTTKAQAVVADRDSWRGDVPYCLVRGKKLRSAARKEAVLSIAGLRRTKGDIVADRFKSSDIAWRSIESSNETQRDDQYVYDLCVPGPENFMVGVIACHNSWQKHAYLLRQEGVLKAPVLGVMHAPVDTMLRTPPPVDRPCVVCISDDQRAHYEALFNQPARTCHNGIDLEFYKPMTVPRSGRALFLGRFSTIKGPDLALDACERLGVPLDLVGDTSITNEPEYFQQCAARCDGERSRMVGAASRGECVRWFSQADLLLHPNKRFREPFGLAPVEAMACGLPVLAWDNGAMRETVDHGRSGYLVRSEEELVMGLQFIRDALRGEHGEKVRKECREQASKFSVQNTAARYAALCEEALAGGW